MKTLQRYIIVAVVFAVLTAFCSYALAAPNVPTMQTNKPFVLRDSANNETDYATLSDAMNALQGKSGNFTLYLMKNYDASNENTVKQKGDYDLLVRSGQEGQVFTLSNTKNFHFILDDTVKNTYNDIILDGGATDLYSATSGGILLNSKSNATIGKGCTVQRCIANPKKGGFFPAITLSDADTKLTVEKGAIIQNNFSPRNGTSIIYVNRKATLDIKGGLFTKNTGGAGGVIYSNDGKIYIENAEFINNLANNSGGVIYLNGSQIQNGVCDIKNSTFKNNFAGRGGVLYTEYHDKLNIIDCVFDSNLSGDWGGCLLLKGVQQGKIDNCTFTGNYTYDYGHGAALHITSSDITVSNSTLKNNGKGVINGSEQSTRFGGAIFLEGNENKVHLKNNKLIGNTVAESGGAIFSFTFSGNLYNYDYEQKKVYDGYGYYEPYSDLIIDDDNVFSDNFATYGYSLPPKNYKNFTNLKFKSNSFTGKGYPAAMHLDDNLFNNYDLNFQLAKYKYGFVTKGGRFSDETSERVTDFLQLGDEYTIFSDIPEKGYSEFLGWEDEEGKLHQPGEKLPPATRNRLFIAKWNDPIMTPPTGDTSNIALYVVLAVVAVGIFGFIISKNKRKK